jgi:hypothetical protein
MKMTLIILMCQMEEISVGVFDLFIVILHSMIVFQMISQTAQLFIAIKLISIHPSLRHSLFETAKRAPFRRCYIYSHLHDLIQQVRK